jgi:biotin carboxyl carrier protein
MSGETGKLKAIVNGDKPKELLVSDQEFILEGMKHDWDISKLPDGSFHIILEGRNYLAEILHHDETNKIFQIRMNGNTYDIQLTDRFDDLLQRLGMTGGSLTSAKSIKAPMPGMILKVLVKEGTEVEKDEPLVILKAMKMENVIKSPGKAGISRILVKEGQAVEKNEDLIFF